MPLSPEELEQVKAGNLDPLKDVTGLGIIIRTKAQEDAFQSNFRTTVRDEIVGKEDLPAYKNIEEAIEKLTGVKKNENEKATDYLTRVVSPLQKTVKDKEEEIAALKSQGTDKNNPVLLALQKERDEAVQQRDNAIKEGAEKVNGVYISNELNKMKQAALALPMNVPDDVKPDIVEARIAKWLQANDVRVNGETGIEVFNKAENRVEVNTADFKRKAPIDFVPSIFDNVIAKEGAKGGTGTNGAGKTGGDGGVATGFKSKVELHEGLVKQGLNPNSAEFDKAYQEAQASYQKTVGQPMPIQ